jgi:hypothetical protein
MQGLPELPVRLPPSAIVPVFPPEPKQLPTCLANPVLVALRRYPGIVKHSVLSTTPTAETPALSDEERLERRRRFIERVFSPDGLDRDTLEHIEQLTDNES